MTLPWQEERRRMMDSVAQQQERFRLQLRRQIAVSNRLSAQRNAILDVAEEILHNEVLGSLHDEYAAKLEAAKNLDPESG